jgi:hypothetical protein
MPEKHEHRDGVVIQDSFGMPMQTAMRWFNQPRGWQRTEVGIEINYIRVGMTMHREQPRGSCPTEDCLVIALDRDVHHIILNTKQAALLAAVLDTFARTGEVRPLTSAETYIATISATSGILT